MWRCQNVSVYKKLSLERRQESYGETYFAFLRKQDFIEWERVGQGRRRPARSCLKIAIFPKSRAEENPRKTPLLRDRAAERI